MKHGWWNDSSIVFLQWACPCLAALHLGSLPMPWGGGGGSMTPCSALCSSQYSPGALSPSFANALGGEIHTLPHPFKCFQYGICDRIPQTTTSSWLSQRDDVLRCLTIEERSSHMRPAAPCASPSTCYSGFMTNPIFDGAVGAPLLCMGFTSCGSAVRSVLVARRLNESAWIASSHICLIPTGALDYRACVNRGGLVDSHGCRLRISPTDVHFCLGLNFITCSNICGTYARLPVASIWPNRYCCATSLIFL